MSKLNTVSKTGPSSPLQNVADPGVKTYEGGPAAVSDTKTEAFRLGVNLFGGEEPTFYEKGKARDNRFNKLMELLAVSDPTWTFNFLTWLRAEGNIRTASIMGAAHAIHARLQDTRSTGEDELLSSLGMVGINRALASAVCQRADEPGEFAAYYMKTFGPLPKAVKRGLADAANRLYNEYSVMKYDTASHGYRFADVLNLTHAKPANSPDSWKPKWLADAPEDAVAEFKQNSLEQKRDLFGHIINRRYGIPHEHNLPMITANAQLRAEAAKNPEALLDVSKVKAAGLTWEDVLSLAGTKLSKAKVWEAIIPNMGYMALLRNLRNFEEAGISADTRKFVIDKLTDPREVAKSRQFPFRFLTAFQNTNSLQYQAAAEQALDYAVPNIPELDGETLVLVDTSASMSDKISTHSKMSRAGIAALFGAALSHRNAGRVDLVMYASYSKELPVPKGGSVLNTVKEIERRNGEVGHGTETASAIRKHFKPGKHKRVFIFTDGQSFGNYWGAHLGDTVPKDVFMYAFDLAGYKQTDMATGYRRVQLAGLTDATFKFVPLYEAGETGKWPWEK